MTSLLLTGLCAGAMSELVAADETATPAAAPLPIEFQPYHVSIELSGDPRSPTAASTLHNLRTQLPALLNRSIGPRWFISWPSDAAKVDTPSPRAGDDGSVEPPVSSPKPDVAYHVDVTGRPGRLTAAIDAYEPLWDRHSPRITVETADFRELPALVVPALARLFRPRALWERLDNTQVRLRIQGAALAEPDPALPLLEAPEVFEPWIVFLARGDSPPRLAEIPFTLYVVEEHEQGRAIGHVVSGLRNPLTSRPRGRVELLAVASRAQWSGTELQLVARSQPPRLLVAHNVAVHEGLLNEPAAEEVEPLKLVSDRRGRVQLEARPGLPWVLARVSSGDQILAEVPVVPGAAQVLKLELPDDQIRLRAEGELRLLQGELVSIVAERTALMLATRAAAKRVDWKAVDALLTQLNELPTAAKLRERVSGVRVPAVAAARSQKDTLTDRRVQRLCDETEEMIQRYLADDKVKLIVEEMAELKSAAAAADAVK